MKWYDAACDDDDDDDDVQRPSAKDLLKHRFISKGKKTSFLTELVDRYKQWKISHPDSDDDADDSDKYERHLRAIAFRSIHVSLVLQFTWFQT